MSTLPGFKYDKRTKVLRLSCYARGGKGKVRRERTIRVDSIEQARAEWAKFQEEISRLDGPHDVTFDVYVARELDEVCKRVRPSTAEWYRDIVTTRLLPHFKKEKLSGITKGAVQDYVAVCRADRQKPVSAARINGILRVLRLLLHRAVDRGYIPSYPLHKLEFEKVTLPEQEMKRHEQAAFLAAFSDEQAFMTDLVRRMPTGRVISIASSPVASMGTNRKVGAGMRAGSAAAKAYFARFRASKELFVVAIETGLRREDLRQLKWENVDLGERWIRVVSKKTQKMVAIPITNACRDALLALRGRPVVSTFVFITSKGKVLSNSTINDYYALAKRLGGITDKHRFHDLRHTFGCNATSNGIPLQFVQKALAHASLATTLRYARPDDESVQQAFLGVQAAVGSRD